MTNTAVSNASHSPALRSRFLLPATMFLSLGLLWLLVYRRYALAFLLGLGSDDANILLEAQAVLGGNPLLKHWVLTTFSAYTTDLPYYTVASALTGGARYPLLAEVPAFLFTLCLGAAMWLAGGRPAGGARSRFGMFTCFVLMGMPSALAAFNALQGPTHAATMLPCLLAFLALDTPESRRDSAGRLLSSLSWVRLGIATALLTLAKFGDDMALYVAVAPLALVALTRLLRGEGTHRSEISVLGVCAAALLLSKAGMAAMGAMGGFQIPADSYAQHLSFVSFLNFPSNVWWTAGNLLQLYGAEFFSADVSPRVGITLAKGIGLCLVFYALVRCLSLWRPYPLGRTTPRPESYNRIDRLSATLALGMLISLLAYACSDRVVENQSARYLLPFFYMAAVLVGRFGLEAAPSRGRFQVLVGVVAIATGVSFLNSVRQTAPADVPATRLAAWLEERGLRDGYGAYWCSSITTLVSEGRVRVRALRRSENGNGKMEPLIWGVDTRWYQSHGPVRFVVVDSLGTYAVTEKNVIQAFGNPDATHHLEDYTILVWNQDISPRLSAVAAP
ncbi:MAG: hypothetical protein H7Z41_17985 [Cytophagales bacterium]|nr:hypothetical protein [Armatimonadota bacterium]